MTKRSFQSRLEEMVETLRAHPDVVVFDFHLSSPASGAVIREAEARSGFVLPEAMVEFYASHNGIFLEWGLRGESYTRTDPYEYPHYGSPPGCINMLPISAVMTKDWLTSCHVNELELGQEELFFGQKLDPERPIETVTLDNFSKFNHADLVLGPEPVVIVSTDHGADLYSSDFMSFEVYLEVLLAVFATNRYAATRSDEPQRLLAPRDRPALDELIEGLRDRE